MSECLAVFQSTLPRGERPFSLMFIAEVVSFNPRSRVGSDQNSKTLFYVATGFNPRSRVGSDSRG